MIDVKKLKQLIELMKENEITELDIRDQEGQVTLKRGTPGSFVPTVTMTPVASQAPASAPAPVAPGTAAAAADDGLIPIASPMVGTFYTAASPDAEAFAKVGQSIGKESVVCIIEAMKVFNEIKAEVSGTIQRVLVSNGQAVEFGQPLFMVKPN